MLGGQQGVRLGSYRRCLGRFGGIRCLRLLAAISKKAGVPEGSPKGVFWHFWPKWCPGPSYAGGSFPLHPHGPGGVFLRVEIPGFEGFTGKLGPERFRWFMFSRPASKPVGDCFGGFDRNDQKWPFWLKSGYFTRKWWFSTLGPDNY